MKFFPKFSAFLLSFVLGLVCNYAVHLDFNWVFGREERAIRDSHSVRGMDQKGGSGFASDSDPNGVDHILNDNPSPKRKLAVTEPLRIISKQKAQYTEAARVNEIQGTVTLRVTFLANGEIGSIVTVKGLPYGLTEQAFMAARAIRFEPETVNGVPRTTSRPVSFTFNIY